MRFVLLFLLLVWSATSLLSSDAFVPVAPFDQNLRACLRDLVSLGSVSGRPAEPDGVRLNKAFRATHSRRQADGLIADGRVTVNGAEPDTMGVRLHPGDVVELDGKRVQWERLNRRDEDTARTPDNKRARGQHTYIKYWKPRGVECTTDRRVSKNIMDALGPIPGVKDRLWPMGRLDKDSTGLILITSDGAATQRLLKSESAKWKTYLVETDRRATDRGIQQLAEGVRILSHTSRDGKTNTRWITTQPAIVERGPDSKRYRNQLSFKICEGKNRQIRRMCETLGLTVERLHRIEFAGITLNGCPSSGTWAFLSDEEVRRIKKSPPLSRKRSLHVT